MFKKGEVYLAKLNPKKASEVGKIRPILIYQSDILSSCGHLTTTILPISTQLIDNTYPLRYRVNSRDKLERDSDILCDQIRTIDNSRIISTLLTKLSLEEILEVDKQVSIVLDIDF